MRRSRRIIMAAIISPMGTPDQAKRKSPTNAIDVAAAPRVGATIAIAHAEATLPHRMTR
jgi:hypothetical protein